MSFSALRTRRARGDRGAVLMLFALSLASMAVVAALVLGASNGYSGARSAQNAVDAAAAAASHRLHQVATGDATADEVADTAESVAEDNGAEPGSVECEVVSALYALTKAESDVIGPCDGTNETDALAAGVRVTAYEEREVPFGPFVGADTIRASARAAATVQPVRQASSPFMVCSSAAGHPVPVLVEDTDLYPPWDINAAAVGQSYVLWGNAMKDDGRDCGNGSASWRGLVDFEKTFAIPSPDGVDDTGWWEVDTGNKAGLIQTDLTGNDTCGDGSSNQTVDSLAVGCRVTVPMCTHGNGETGVNFKLHCVRLAAFEVTWVGGTSSPPAPCMVAAPNNTICGTLLGTATGTSGTTGATKALSSEVVAVRLVE